MAENLVRVFDYNLWLKERGSGADAFLVKVRSEQHMCATDGHGDIPGELLMSDGSQSVHIDWTRLVPESEVRR